MSSGSDLSHGDQRAHNNPTHQAIEKLNLNLSTAIVELSRALGRIHEQQDTLRSWHENFRYLHDDYQDLQERYQQVVDLNFEYAVDLGSKEAQIKSMEARLEDTEAQLKSMEIDVAARRLENEVEIAANTGYEIQSSPESMGEFCDLFAVSAADNDPLGAYYTPATESTCA